MRNQRKIIDPKLIKKHAAAIIAAAIALAWIALELVLFIGAIPSVPEMLEEDYCLSEDHEHIFSKGEAIYFSDTLGEIDSISFSSKMRNNSVHPSRPVTVEVLVLDSTNTKVLSTSYTEKFCVGDRTVIDVDIPEDRGEVWLKFGYSGYDYVISDIKFNSPEDASFNFLRTGIVVGIIVICWLCHRFKLWRVFFDPKNKNHSRAGIALVVLCVLIALLFSSVLNGDKTSVEYPLKWDPVYYSTYEQQFDALMKGQLHLDIEPSKELLELENPYDPSQRGGVEYSWDRALYDGKYYSYFGLAPILTVYFPYYFLTGDMPAENLVTTIYAIMTALFFSLAAVKWASMYTKKLPLPLLFIGTVGGIISSQVFLMMRGREKFYYIATIAGMAFLSLFLWLLLCGISGSVRFAPEESPRKWKKLVLYTLAGLAYGLIFMSRVNIALLAAFIVLPMLLFKVITETGEGGKMKFRKLRAIIPELLALGIPVMIIMAAQLAINYIRFDSIFEFGSTYQLTVSDVSKYKIRLSDLPYAIYHYFLQPLAWTTDFPFASLGYETLGDYGHYVYVDSNMGMLAIPMMWMLFGSALIFANKKRSLEYKVTLGSALVGIVVMALFDFCLGGVLFRYTCDLTLLGAFAAVVIMFSLCEDVAELDGEGRLARSLGRALSVLVIISAVISLTLAFSINVNMTSYSPKAYDVFRELFFLLTM